MPSPITEKIRIKSFKSISGGKASNIILGEITAELPYEEKIWHQLEASCKGNDSFVLTKNNETIFVVAKGISTHMMHVEESLNAGKVLFEMLAGCDALSANDRAALKTASVILEDAYGTGLGIAHDDELFGKLVCGNGIINTTAVS